MGQRISYQKIYLYSRKGMKKMNIVKFPLLNLELEISEVAINIFGLGIKWYAIIIVFCIILALIWCKFKSKKYDIDFDEILNLFIILIPTVIICARLYYVIFNLDYYLKYPIEILNIRAGGLAIYGGIIGGIIASYIYCRIRKINVLNLLDCIAPILALSQGIGRWGNFINSEAYGTETNLPWKMGIVENGVEKFVHPTFLYESIGTVIIFIILTILQNKSKFEGQIAYTYLALYSLFRFFIEGLRADSLMLFNFRISQILSLIIFVLSVGIIIESISKSKRMSKNEEE